MTIGRRGFVFAAALVLLLAPAEVRAGQPTDQLRTQIDRVLRVLEDPELKKEGKVKATRYARPWTLVHAERFEDSTSARRREYKLKSMKSRTYLEAIIGRRGG